MAIPTSGYPTTLDDTNASPGATVEFPQPGSSTDLDATNVEHDLLHTNGSLAIVALQTKLGITDSNAAANQVLVGTGASTTAWGSTLTSMTLAGATISGAVDGGAQVISNPVVKDYGETVNVIGATGGGTQDIDLEDGNVVTATVTASANTFTFSNPSTSGVSCSFTLILTNGGSQTVNWPGSVDWAAATAPTLTAAGVDVLTFMTVDAGTIWYGFAGGLAMG
jgi:hypothetical protein|tara:strand:- start:3358 stop:4026 length:669 start_codon:yes stop_codon:yes gene_type:complete